MGMTAAETLVQRINAPKNAEYPKSIVVEPELIVRGSTARCIRRNCNRNSLSLFPGDDVHIDFWRFAQKSVRRGIDTRYFLQPCSMDLPKITCVMCFSRTTFADGVRDADAFQFNHFGTEIFRKVQIGRQQFSCSVRAVVAPGIHVNDIKFRIQPAGHARGAGNQILRAGLELTQTAMRSRTAQFF